MIVEDWGLVFIHNCWLVIITSDVFTASSNFVVICLFLAFYLPFDCSRCVFNVTWLRGTPCISCPPCFPWNAILQTLDNFRLEA